MINTVKQLLHKKKFQHFLYVHVLFVAGLLGLDISVKALLISLIFHVLILSPFMTLVTHLKFNHDQVTLKNSFLEWLSLIMMCVYSFWPFRDVKSYHIQHHKTWLTAKDPTASEIAQGPIRYYVGITEPCAITPVNSLPDSRVKFVNDNFYFIKFSVYFFLASIFGFTMFFYMIIAQQFFFYVTEKIHDMAFHSSPNARDKPWLFPLYFNNSWHITHHKDYNRLEAWHCPWINPQYWLFRLFFKQVSA